MAQGIAVAGGALSPGLSRYLEALYYLRSEGLPSKASRLAGWLGVSPPTVAEALRRLSRDGYVDVRADHQVRLTATGRAAAERVVRRHRVLEHWLTTGLGLDWVEADEEAHILAGAVSDRLLERLYERLDRPTTCPHGNPIPGVPQPRRHPVNLVDLPEGTTATVDRISEVAEHDAPDVLRLLQRGGVLPGTPVRLASRTPGSGVLELLIGRQPVHLATEVARCVWLST